MAKVFSPKLPSALSTSVNMMTDSSTIDFSPYKWSGASLIQPLAVATSPVVAIEFFPAVASIQKIREVAATVRIYFPSTGLESTDPTDIYEFSLTRKDSPALWIPQGNLKEMIDIIDGTVGRLPSVLPGEPPLPPDGTLAATFTLRARVNRGGSYIDEISTDIIIDEVKPITSTSPVAGIYPSAPLPVTLSAIDYTNTTIYYTTDGSNPTTSSPIYSTPITVTSPTIIKAFAIDAAGNIETPNWGLQENSFFFNLDAGAPTVFIDQISDVYLGVGEAAEVLWHVDESCNSVVFELGGSGAIGTGTVLQTLSFAEKNIVQTTNIESGQLPVGTSVIYVYAVDTVGNIGYTAFSLTFSSSIPVITIYEICRQTIAPTDIATIVWATNIGGAYEVRLDSANMGEGYLISQGTVLPYTIIETPVPSNLLAENIANTVKVYVASPSGNIGSRSARMSVDSLPPRVTTNYVTSDGPFTAPFVLNIRAVDAPIIGVPIDWEDVVIDRFVPVSAGTNFATDSSSFGIGSFGPTDATTIGNIRYSDPSSLIPNLAVSVVNFSPYRWSPPSAIQTLDIFTALAISNIREANKQATEIHILWDTNRAANSKIEYSLDPTLASGVIQVFDPTLSMGHDLTLANLTENTVYYYRITSTNGPASSSSAILSFRTNSLTDTIPPTITNVQATALSYDTIQVTWNTDELADSVVIYGLNADLSDGIILPAIETSGVSFHTYMVTGLNPETQYYFRARSRDLANNETTDTYIVSATTWDTNAPVISNITIHTYRTVTVIRWRTNEPTIASVEYGETDSYGYVAQDVAVFAPGEPAPLNVQHEVILTNLTPDRLYHFNLRNVDTFGNSTGTVDRTLETQANRDTRVAIYAVLDALSEPSPSNFDCREIGRSLTLNISSSTVIKYIAYDGFGNSSPVYIQRYSFDLGAPIITFDRFIPEPKYPTGLVLGKDMDAIVRFKISENANYQIKNQSGTILATGSVNGNVWTDANIHSMDLLEGNNYITIEAADLFGNPASVSCGNIILDTIPPITVAFPIGGYYNQEKLVTLTPQSLREGEHVTIYYTIDGSLPTRVSPCAVDQVKNIPIQTTTTLRWFSIDDVGNIEPAKFATYFLDSVAPTIQASPSPGIYDDIVSVALMANEPSTIFYTLDGQVPTINSDVYTGPIEIANDTDIRCFARDLAGNISEHYVFVYQVKVIHDKKFKKVIGFQDKYLLETEFNEAQDNVNRRIEEITHDVVGMACITSGLDIIPTEANEMFEFYIKKGKAYIGGKFVTVARRAQGFVPSPRQIPGDKVFHVIIKPSEPIFKPIRPGHPGWEEGVPEITTYRLEESFLIDAVEVLPDNEPYMELYEVRRPATASSLQDCIINDKRHFFEPLCEFQQKTKDAISEMQANMLALGLELESHKLRNLLGLKNVFVDTFETKKDINLSQSHGFRYEKTRFEL